MLIFEDRQGGMYCASNLQCTIVILKDGGSEGCAGASKMHTGRGASPELRFQKVAYHDDEKQAAPHHLELSLLHKHAGAEKNNAHFQLALHMSQHEATHLICASHYALS